MIKISYKQKIFLIRQPQNLEILKNIFKTKFKLDTLEKYNFSYIDINNDEISIENDEDLLCAYSCSQNCLKILLNKEIIAEKEKLEKNLLDKNCLKFYSKFLEKKLPFIDEELEEKLDNQLMPCKYCFFKSDLKSDNSFDDSQDCPYCKNEKYRPISNNIKMLLHVANSKIKKYFYDPINLLKNKKEIATNKKLEKPDVTKLSSISHSEDDQTSLKRKLKPKLSLFTKTNNINHLQEKQQKKSHLSLKIPYKSAIYFNNNFEKKEPEDEKLILPPTNDFPIPPKVVELKFSIVDSSAIFDCKKIDVKLVIGNKNDFDWPNISICGVDKGPTRDLDIKIKDIIETGKVKAIKFSFETNSGSIKNLEFYFYHANTVTGIIYVSKRFKIKISKEESCFIFKLCNFI